MSHFPPLAGQTSLELINEGSEEEFVEALLFDIQAHPALNHPYLVSLGSGTLPNTEEAIRDYAHQYSFYSSYFVKYLDGVINTLGSEDHKAELRENIESEKGNPEAVELAERPHVEIFSQFKKDVGIDLAYESANPPSTTALLWRDLFLQKCRSTIPGVGIGAIGIATENIVPHIYKYIVAAIEEHSDHPSDASFFFRLHMDCDDGHAESLIEVTTDIAKDFETREAIRFGVISSLNLRTAFWDSQYARALKIR